MTARHLALAHLFRSTAQAHNRVFASCAGEDADWPHWYARELAAPLNSLLGSTVEPGDLATALRKLDQSMRGRALGLDWTLYYADWFLGGRLKGIASARRAALPPSL